MIVLVYITAVSLAIFLFNVSGNNLSIIKNSFDDTHIISRQQVDDPAALQVKGADIIVAIKNGLNTDITVDSVNIPRSIDPTTYDYSFIQLNRPYTATYIISNRGVVTYVFYD